MPRPRVVFLGTGAALNPERYQAAILVERGPTRVVLDTGGGLGVVRRLRAAEVEPRTVGHVFLSHRHLDHVGGLEPLLLSISLPARYRDAPMPAVRVYALPASATAIRAALAAADASGERWLGDHLTWVTPAVGAPVPVAEGVWIKLIEVDHLPPGGGAAGCVLTLDGLRVAYSGDTRPCPALADAARGADLLVHEVAGLDARAEIVHRVGHSTAAEAGRIAAQAGVRALALVHLPAPAWVAPADLLAEARRHAPGVEVFLAEDGMVWGM
jgi:ribonuclease Z